ncbi:MAG: isocitrate lyase/phosphoenolpyruvate mutase family protein [Rhodobacteraceae bacterium]|nr:isocitrate lyase/phosphoenolpyruvate mutase family protein [Paracoccaceae bacterium]
MTQDIGAVFRALHRPGDPFILGNAWDAGSAKMLAALGAPAIATSSAAHAFTLGRKDGGTLSRDEALAHAADLVAAVDVPVSGDFENGFGDAPETCAETVRLSFEAGLAGISIEDTDFAVGAPFDRDLAVERIRAAAAAARAGPRDFVLVARADGIMEGTYDIDEAVARLEGFAEAGADCLYAPLPKSFEDLARIVAIGKPVNVLAAGPWANRSRQVLAGAGAARISLGSALARVTHRVIRDAAVEMFENGSFSALGDGMPGADVDKLMG